MSAYRLLVLRSFIVAIALAIVFLVPSTGLSTLTIPDDAYGNTSSTLQDLPHPGKRVFDGVQLFVGMLAAALLGLLFVVSAAIRTTILRLQRIVQKYLQIRGPPRRSFLLCFTF